MTEFFFHKITNFGQMVQEKQPHTRKNFFDLTLLLKQICYKHRISNIELISNRYEMYQDLFLTEYYLQKRNKYHVLHKAL